MTTRYETFSYTPIELATSLTGTVHDTLIYLHRHDYITDDELDHLTNTLAVYALPNRKGFGKKLRERFFGKNENEASYVFPIVEIDSMYSNSPAPNPRTAADSSNVVDINSFKKDTD